MDLPGRMRPYYESFVNACRDAFAPGGEPAMNPQATHPVPPSTPSPPGFDALTPAAMAEKAGLAGEKKIGGDTLSTLALAVLAGAFISLGAIFSTTTIAGAGDMPFGVTRLLAGLTFSLGLILVIVGGAELFTGNMLIVIAWAERRVATGKLLRSWLLVYLGNFAGALATAGLLFLSGQYAFGTGAVGAAALTIAQGKNSLDFTQAIALGILCNGLVCLAVWLTYSARTTTDRILAIVPPITAFVAAGFEHSIANMYFIPVAIFIKDGAPASFWSAIGRTPADFPALTWDRFLLGNLLPVTIGNMIGGGLLVAVVYWFVYLRPGRE